jgi:hypothetical protein
LLAKPSATPELLSVSLREWGKIPIEYLKNIRIDRRNLLTYVANKLGGVHYESKRLPSDRDDARQFKVLATAYDWENRAIMHAGLVGTAIACLELINTEVIRDLVAGLEIFHAKRQENLMQEPSHDETQRG